MGETYPLPDFFEFVILTAFVPVVLLIPITQVYNII